MGLIDPNRSTLLLIDFQGNLMDHIDGADRAVAHARRLMEVASILEIPTLHTEQNPGGLGNTIPELAPVKARGVVSKMHFDATRSGELLGRVPRDHQFVVAGCETHVCVLQTVLGLCAAGRSVFVASDAVGSRRASDRDTALARMRDNGAEIVSTEMVIFEWLEDCRHERFREVLALVKPL